MSMSARIGKIRVFFYFWYDRMMGSHAVDWRDLTG